MDIDSAPVPPPQEYSDNPTGYQSESSMNFDYLHGLNEGASAAARASSSATSLGGHGGSSDSPRHFGAVGGGGIDASTSSMQSYGYVDDSKALDRPFNLNERFVSVLDQLDARVEKFRKDAMGLQEKKDFLLMSIDLIKSHDMLHSMMESEREEIFCYIQRVNSRLSTVDLMVHTVRDRSQEDALSQINELIDIMITMGDPVLARQRCQQYLNACCSAAEAAESYEYGVDVDAGPIDKKFEGALLGCTLDDQKNIKKRLQALMGYLNKQTVRN
ncbi:BAG family molecular chaperone regulator 2-like isoform X3 [Anastrepha obliqua]|uniref:BAG family molecular chaperone regulator 2-like isoform X3 n=1 Tax=Anastrepha obliqua TaxID=95512 RepID=UPI00240A1B0B|nr:BAG family molecular chaperone regulator 2-like isoform X3 [Anastrepha obliqua]